MEFSEDDWTAIERACELQAQRERENAALVDRPMIRNQRIGRAEELEGIARRIAEDRRQRAMESARCTNCDD